ncbi:GTPase domain-containing protein [Candidatus Lokiarchaeum ossiferum]
MENSDMDSDKKLVILGPPNCGKTSILLSIFGSVEPDLILASPAEPTRGMENSVYRYGHVNIGVHDLSGQELNFFLTNEQDFIFPGTDELLIVFEFGMNPKKIVGLIKVLLSIVKKFKIPYYYLILHKIDKAKTINERETYIATLKKNIDDTFGMDRIKIFATSLFPDHFGKFKFQMDWMLTALEISVRNMKELRAVPVSEALLKSLRTAGFIGVNLDDDSLAEVPKVNPNGYNEMATVKKDLTIQEIERDRD